MNKRKRTPNSETATKYLDWMKDVASMESCNPNDITTSHAVSRHLATHVLKMGWVTKIGQGEYKWTGPKPTIEMVNAYLKERQKHHRKLRLKNNQVEQKVAVKLQKKQKPSNGQTRLPLDVIITEDMAIQVLKNSPHFQYEIFKIEKTKI
jgi:hypothetical protein